MRAFSVYALQRLGQFVLVVFIGINIAYLISHSTPIDPVEQSVAAATSFGQTSPEAINMLRESLRELYGVTGTPLQQYTNFWRRIAVADFGPSLSAFPTPVTTLIGRALPWTIGLLATTTLLAWIVGNVLGGLAGYYRESRFFRFLGVISMGLHPVPYYIAGFVLIVIFGYLWPILPITGGRGMNMGQQWDLDHVLSILRHAILPAASLMLISVGGWFLGMRSLVSNVVTEDYVTYAELGGVAKNRILYSYVMRNALVPQVTGLAMSLGTIFNGAVITEQIFGYPGIGALLVSGVYAGDYGLVLGVTTMSIIGVSTAVLLIDLVYPLLDPARGGSLTMWRTLRDLLRTNVEFAVGFALTAIVVLVAALSFFTPYPPMDTYVTPPDVPPGWPYVLGTTSRGQDVFWELTVAIRNTLLFGIAVAFMSRVMSLGVGLLSGYKGGWVDRVLMSINDTFIVIPLLPILVLFYFVMRDSMTWGWLAFIMAMLGWAYDARLIRSVAISLRSREFTRTSVFSGMSTFEILRREHLPYVLPILFSTTLNNMNWSIGLQVTLAVLGFTDINTPSIGGMIYWANQHTAMVAGVWWWIAFPVVLVMMVFIGLYLLAVSMNEFIDPRSRLSRMGSGS